MSTHNALGGREFVDVVVACTFTIDTCLDTVTLRLDLREGEIDFSSNASDIRASKIYCFNNSQKSRGLHRMQPPSRTGSEGQRRG